jgi:hypothetical protein
VLCGGVGVAAPVAAAAAAAAAAEEEEEGQGLVRKVDTQDEEHMEQVRWCFSKNFTWKLLSRLPKRTGVSVFPTLETNQHGILVVTTSVLPCF